MNRLLNEDAFTTSAISRMFGFYMTGEFIEKTLGVKADYKSNNCKMWRSRKISQISYELSQHCYGVGEEYLNNLPDEEIERVK